APEASASDARASDAHAGGLPYALCLYQDTDLSRVEQNLGRPIDALQDYNSRTDWTSWAAIGSWPLNSVSKPIPLSVGLILDTGADLATAASGGYDSYYQQLAQSL